MLTGKNGLPEFHSDHGTAIIILDGTMFGYGNRGWATLNTRKRVFCGAPIFLKPGNGFQGRLGCEERFVMKRGPFSRRDFILTLGAGACIAGSGFWPARGECGVTGEEASLKEIRFYKQLEDGRIQCQVCPRGCKIADQERGYCGNKENRGGKYYSLVYGRPCAVNIDPIEKKPLFHVFPGSSSFSIATAGCNIECHFCQNWQIAQFRPEQVRSEWLPPEAVVDMAKSNGCQTVAYTYSEPVTFYDYMLDTAIAGERRGIGSVVITNGYINEEPLRLLCEHVTAVKVDLKAFTEKFYKEICRGELKPVQETLRRLVGWGMWTEIVVLIIPTLNDDPAEITEMAKWISGELSPQVPVHFTRFHPCYKIKDLPPTPVATLERCHALAREQGLQFAYVGNLPGHSMENTHCPKCGEVVVGRVGFTVTRLNLNQGRCGSCGQEIPGKWSP
jgi:pyruvate formate lyase activating enzyme